MEITSLKAFTVVATGPQNPRTCCRFLGVGLKTNDVHKSNYKRGYRFLTLCYVPGEVIQKGR